VIAYGLFEWKQICAGFLFLVYINKTNNLLQLKQKKTMIYGIGNLGYGLGQAQKCGWVKNMVNGIPTLPL
jgi:hypothetical protein